MNEITADWVAKISADPGVRREGTTWYNGRDECILELWLPDIDDKASVWSMSTLHHVSYEGEKRYDLHAVWTAYPEVDVETQLRTLSGITVPKIIVFDLKTVGSIDFIEGEEGTAEIWLGETKVGMLTVDETDLSLDIEGLTQYSSDYLRRRIEGVYNDVLSES